MRGESIEGLLTINMATQSARRQRSEESSKEENKIEARLWGQSDTAMLRHNGSYIILRGKITRKNKSKTRNTVNTGQCDTVANDWQRRSVKCNVLTPFLMYQSIQWRLAIADSGDKYSTELQPVAPPLVFFYLSFHRLVYLLGTKPTHWSTEKRQTS